MKLQHALQKLKTAVGTLSLSLYRQNIGLPEINQLLEAIIANTKLTSLILNLSNNKIGNDSVINIGKAIATDIKLSSFVLELQGNELEDSGIEEIGKAIAVNTELTSFTLDLNNNRIGDLGIIEIGKGIAANTNLTSFTLNLIYNNIKIQGAEAMGNAIATNKKLTSFTLRLQGNTIKDFGASKLGQGIIAHPKLVSVKLNLIHTGITFSGATTLAEYIKNSSAKIELEYSSDKVGKEGRLLLTSALNLNADPEYREKIAQTKSDIILPEEEIIKKDDQFLERHKNKEFEYSSKQNDVPQLKATFKSNECFILFKEHNIDFCVVDTNKPIADIEYRNELSGKGYLFVESWLIDKSSEELYSDNYYELCLKAFKEKDYVACNSEESYWWYVAASIATTFAMSVMIAYYNYGSITKSLIGYTEEGRVDE